MTTYIGTGFSANKNPFEAAKSASLQAKAQINQQKPDLVFIFTTIHFPSAKLIEGIYNIFGQNIRILGCSGYAVITGTGIHKYGIALMAVYSTKIEFSTGLLPQINKTNLRESGERFGHSLLKNLNTTSREAGIIFSDGLIEGGSQLLSGIKDVLGRSFPIIGGSAADNLRFLKTYQYFNKEILNNAVVGAILSGEAVFGYGLRHGWQPLGKTHLVTEAEGNVIKKIENKPAVEIYQDYFKKTIKELKSMLMQIGILYPLGIYLAGESEYLLRNPIRIGNDGSLSCQGDIPEGSELRLMMGTKESALQATRQAVVEAKNTLKNSPVLGAIIFDSVSRINLLGYRANEETTIIKDILGTNTPFIGVCTFGEQAPLKSLEYHGESRFHNETIAALTIGERRVLI